MFEKRWCLKEKETWSQKRVPPGLTPGRSCAVQSPWADSGVGAEPLQVHPGLPCSPWRRAGHGPTPAAVPAAQLSWWSQWLPQRVVSGRSCWVLLRGEIWLLAEPALPWPWPPAEGPPPTAGLGSSCLRRGSHGLEGPEAPVHAVPAQSPCGRGRAWACQVTAPNKTTGCSWALNQEALFTQ